MFEVSIEAAHANHTQHGMITYWAGGKPDPNQRWAGRYLHYTGWAFGSCACGSLQGFSNAPQMADDPYGFFAALYDVMTKAGRSYKPYNIFFMVSDTQLGKGKYGNAGVNALVKLLLDNGAELKDEFENEAHGPNKVYLYRFNIKNVIGKYINDQGIALKKETKDAKPSTTAATAKVQPAPALDLAAAVQQQAQET